jgi:hypothetical protein
MFNVKTNFIDLKTLRDGKHKVQITITSTTNVSVNETNVVREFVGSRVNA